MFGKVRPSFPKKYNQKASSDIYLKWLQGPAQKSGGGDRALFRLGVLKVSGFF
jgi:hypothetical protein